MTSPLQARRCKEKDAALADRDAFVAKLQRRLLQHCQLPAAAQLGGRELGASGQAAPQSEQAGTRPHAGSSDASSWHAAGGVAASSPGAQSLAFLSPDPGPSAWLPREEQHAWQGQAEQRLQEQPWGQHGRCAGGDAPACVGGGGSWGAEAAASGASPGVEGLGPGASPEDLLPRRLQWPTSVAHAGCPAQPDCATCSLLAAATEQASWRGAAAQHEDQCGADLDEGWAAYQLGSPTPAPPASGPPDWSLCGALRAGMQLGSGSSNPLFSFHQQPAESAGRAAGGKGAAAEEHAVPPAGSGRWRPNALFASPPQQPLQPQHQQQQQPGRRLSCNAEPPRQLPPRMPSGDFSSVSALLEALGPATQQAQQQMRARQLQPQVQQAVAAPAEEAAVADTPSILGIRRLAAGCPPTEDAIEQKLQAAVACFFAESAQKGQSGRRHAEPADAPSQQQLQQQVKSGADRAAPPVGPAAVLKGPARELKHGRFNRAADQHWRRGSIARRHG